MGRTAEGRSVLNISSFDSDIGGNHLIDPRREPTDRACDIKRDVVDLERSHAVSRIKTILHVSLSWPKSSVQGSAP
eukprot:2030157-Rhodomonas_salina.2